MKGSTKAALVCATVFAAVVLATWLIPVSLGQPAPTTPTTTPMVVYQSPPDMDTWSPANTQKFIGWCLLFAIPTAIGLYATIRTMRNTTAIQGTQQGVRTTANVVTDMAKQANQNPSLPINVPQSSVKAVESVAGTGTGTSESVIKSSGTGTGLGSIPPSNE